MGKVEGGMKCVKYLLFVFNFIFWVSSRLKLRADWMRAEQYHSFSCIAPMYPGVYILIGAGSLIMLVGFFGCCGAVRESQCLLGSFFACLLIIFGSEVAAGVFGFLNKDKIIEDVQNFYKKTYDENNNSTMILSYQKVLNCCGTKASRCFESGSNTTVCNQLQTLFPNDCDPKHPDSIQRNLTALIFPLQDCESRIEEFFNNKLYIIGYVGIGIAGVMIIGMIFSMVLCCAVRNSREVI
uniref:Tetraspanin n=1 Tax=Nothobranchius furzeri TaxID=105023 RepID=A0A8C6KZ94_NOTFU